MISELILKFTFPLLITLLAFLKLVSVYIFSNIEFKTQTYRYLKLISIIDLLLLSVSLFLPLTEWIGQSYQNIYWSLLFQFYIKIFFGRCLQIANTLLVLRIIWIHYRNLYGSKIYGTNLNFILASVVIISLIFNLPVLILNKIELVKNITINIMEKYQLEARYKNNSINFIEKIFQFAISISILIVIMCLNSAILYKIKRLKSMEIKSVIFTRSKMRFCFLTRNRLSGQCGVLVSHLPSTLGIRKTKLLVIFTTFAFSIDQALNKGIYFMANFLLKNESQNLTNACYVTLILTQLFQIVVYFKYSNSFAKRFKRVFTVKKT